MEECLKCSCLEKTGKILKNITNKKHGFLALIAAFFVGWLIGMTMARGDINVLNMNGSSDCNLVVGSDNKMGKDKKKKKKD